MGVDLARTTPSAGGGNILDRIGSESGGLGQGLASGLTGIIGGIADAINGIFTPGGLFSSIGLSMQGIRDGQLDLEDRTDLLSPLLDYGSAFIDPANLGSGGVGPVPFSKQLGPMRGCEMIGDTSGGIRLLDEGLWDIRVHVSMDSFFSVTASGQTRLRLQVWSPDGALYSEQISNLSDINVLTLTVSSSVVVPESGYRVRARLSTNVSGRRALGGPAWSRLTVQHIARDVDGPWSTGSESSETPSD